VWFSILVVEGGIELRRRLLLSAGIATGAVALLAAPTSSLGAEPPVSFAAPITTEMPDSGGSLSATLATADFNGDGHDDAVVYAGSYQTEAHSLQVAMSEVTAGGSEAWAWDELPVSPVTEFGSGAVATGQMDPGTDSIPDVVALAESEGEGNSLLSVYLGEAAGGFATPVDTNLPGYANGLAVGDVNGDGIPDVLIPTLVEQRTGEWNADVVTLLGKGEGRFEPPIVSPVDAAVTAGEVFATAIVIGDFTGSGHADIAVSQAYNAAHDAFVMSGDGEGDFTVRTELGMGAAYDLASGDFNEDGHADLALAVGGPELSNHTIAEERIATALSDGTGSFAPVVPQGPTWEAENPYSYEIRSADLNGDGRPDLLVPVASDPGEGGVWALLGNGDGTFSTAYREGLEGENVWAAEAGDFDGDGRPDIAALVSPSGPGNLELSIYENTSEPALALGASSLDLGSAEVGGVTTVPLAITNSGNYGLPVSSLAVSGADAADFSVNGCTGAPIAPGAACDAQVRFAPSRAGAESATLTISSDDPAQPSVTVALSGTGASPHPGGGEPSNSSGAGGNAGSSGSTSSTKPKEAKGEAAAGARAKLTLAKTASVSKSGFAKLKLTCAGSCTGKLTLSAALKKKTKGKSKAVVTKLGSTSYALGTRSVTLSVGLYAAARAALASAPSDKLRATVAITPAVGAPSKAKLILIASPHH
jgi:FG-GAP-like repeat